MISRNQRDRGSDRANSGGDQRLQKLLVGLDRYLHAFVREVEPTEAEWMAAIPIALQLPSTIEVRQLGAEGAGQH